MNETGKLDPAHRLWEPIHRLGADRLSVCAMLMLGQMSAGTPENQPAGRLVLLALFQLADIESFSPDGYRGTVAADLVVWTGLTESEAEGQLALLYHGGHAQRRCSETGERRYWPPQWAMDWINGES